MGIKTTPYSQVMMNAGNHPLLAPPISSAEITKLALPLFGGTQPATVVVAPAGGADPDPNAGGTEPATTAPAGGDAGTQKEDPIAKLAADPNAIGQLLAQVDQLQKNLTKVTGERDNFISEQQKAERAQQTREQQLETDLAERDQTIAQMDAVIRNMAIGNAILSQKDVQWHSIKQVLAELNPEAFEIDVDLANGTATVTGVENEVKRIAKDCPWLVSTATNSTNSTTRTTTTRQPPSGAPPVAPAGDGSKAAKRAELMKKFPVIAHGRR